jgi:integrase
MYVTWSDVDFHAKKIGISEKLNMGFSPKDKEEGNGVPVPDYLIARLRARRDRYPNSRLIFPLPEGKPDGHMLRTLQELAFKAGLNCGCCYTRNGKCCKDATICHRWGLHKFRRTFATMHHEGGESARTIQRWLRHSSLEITLRYLAGADDKSEKTRSRVNNTFAGLQAPAEPFAV